MPRFTPSLVLALLAVFSPCAAGSSGEDAPIHHVLVLANDLIEQAVEHRLAGRDGSATDSFREARGLAGLLTRSGFPLTTARIQLAEQWSNEQDRLAIETWRQLRRAESDPVRASPEELTSELDACRDLGDRWCEARALLARADCLHQSVAVAAVMDDAATAEAILREAGPSAALGRALILMGDHGAEAQDKADTKRRRHDNAIELARETGDRSVEGRALCGIAFLDIVAGHADAAREILDRIHGLETEAELPRVVGCRVYTEGLGLVFQGKQAEARAIWDEFADSEIAERAPRERFWTLTAGTVVSFSALSDLEGAVTRGKRARELADRLPGVADKARAYVNLATALAIIGRYREIEPVASIGLDLSKRAGLQTGEAICLKSLGNAAHARGDYELALQLCGESLELSVRDADRFYALVCIGGALEARGELEAARVRIEEALSVADRTGDVAMRAHARNSLGRTYHLSGDSERAEEMASEALALLGPEGNALGRAWALKTRGMARTGLLRHSLSLEDLRESFRLFGTLGATDAQAHVAIELGNVQYYLNRPDRALDYYQQALELGRRAGATEAELIALSNIALSKSRYGRASEDRELLLDRARAIDSLDSGGLGVNALLNLADALARVGEAAAVERVTNRALELSAVREIDAFLARGHRLLASACSQQGRHDEAISECRAALDLIDSVDPWTAIGVHWACGNVFIDAGRTADGVEALRAAVRIGEGARAALAQPAFRASFLSDRTGLYADLVQAVLTASGPEQSAEAVGEALRISERFRSWTLLDGLAGEQRTRERKEEPTKPDESKRRSELLADMAQLHLEMMTAAPERRADMLSEIRRLEDRLAATTRSPRTAFHVLGGADSTVRDLYAQLPDGQTAFIEYLLGHRAAYVFALTNDGIRVAELPSNRYELWSDVWKFRSLIRRRGSDPERDERAIRIVGEKLYRSLFAPAKKLLNDTVRRLVICPDGALHVLPFDALVVPGDGQDDSIRYLVEDFQITVVPSLGVFAQLRRADSANREVPPLVAFANPETRPEELATDDGASVAYPPLPYSEDEVRIAARRLGGEARIFMGNEATEANARTALVRGHQVAHFAGHGFLDAGSIGRSGLVLAPDPEAGDDGLLQARELVDLEIEADLVVLSGCSTSGGRLLPGEGPMGLSHAFFQAGAPTILMSLWDIRDRAAAVFMDRFYAGLAEGRSFGGALRAAKLDLIASDREELRHPSVWAPFVMAGLADRRLDVAAKGTVSKPSLNAWIVGLLALSVALWILSALVRRRSRNGPLASGR